MHSSPLEIKVLEIGQSAPDGVKEPPRNSQITDTFRYIGNPDRFCRENLVKYGPIFKTSVFGGTTVFVGSRIANEMIFNGDNKYSEIALPPTTMEMFGEYSLFQRPELHGKRKSALSPAFTGKMLEGYLPHIQTVIINHLNQWPITEMIALTPSVEKISFDILVPLLLGFDPNQDDSSWAVLPIKSKEELKKLYQQFFDGFYGLIKWKSKFTVFGRGYIAREKLMEFMGVIIEQTKKQNIEPTANFISMMLADQKANPDTIFIDVLMRTQCLLQLWGSHYEVTALLASWIYHIGQYPGVIEKIRQELEQMLGHRYNDEPITMTQLKSMKYLEASIKETLRISPPSSTANRRLTKSVVLDGYLFKKGWSVIAEPRIAHIMEEHYQKPDRFEPERFLSPLNEGKKYEFIPFGGGVHQCLGAQLAMTIMKIFASNFIQRFDWELQGTPTFTQFPLKKIKNNYQIKCELRA
jgi:cytochrome P450